MTDMEGVAGIMDFENWCTPQSRYYDLGQEFLTGEVNAAVDGFFAAGATEVVVADGHGAGAMAIHLLDPRAQLMRGWNPPVYPFGLDQTYDAMAWVGQHAKAGTEYAHIAHTGWFNVLDLSINGISVGEFGENAMCASELGIPCILAAGDEAFTREARALIPGIETVAVKQGTTPGTGDDLDTDAYAKRNLAAVHRQPIKARELIRAGAEQALRRVKKEKFGMIPLKPPFEQVLKTRKNGNEPAGTTRYTHPTSVIALLNSH